MDIDCTYCGTKIATVTLKAPFLATVHCPQCGRDFGFSRTYEPPTASVPDATGNSTPAA